MDDTAPPTEPSPPVPPLPTPAAPSGHRGRLLLLAKLGLAATLIGMLVASGRFEWQVFERVRGNGSWFMLGVVILLGPVLITSIRWQLLLRVQGLSCRFGEVLQLNFIGMFFNTVIPGAVGGDVMKAYYLARDEEHGRRALAVMSVAVDRVIGLVALVLLAAFTFAANPALLEQPALRPIGAMALAMVPLSLLGMAALLSERLRRWGPSQRLLARLPALVERLWLSMGAYRQQLPTLAVCMAISTLSHTCTITAIYVFARLLGVEGVSFLSFLFIVPIALLANALPLTPGGIGVGELAFSNMFLLVGSSLGEEICVMMRIGFYLIGLLGVVAYLRWRGRVASAQEEPVPIPANPDAVVVHEHGSDD